MKNRFSRFVSIFWVAVMLTVGLAVLTIAPKGKLQSDTENRYLQEFPALSFESLSSGEFSEGFERFMSDKFFGRDSIILLASEIESGFSILDFDDLLEFGDGVEDTFVDENMPAEDETAPPEDTLTVEDSDAESPEDDRPEDSAEPGSFYGNLSIWAEKADGSRTNLYTASKSSVDMSAEIVNRFADTVPEGNVYYLSVLQAWHANKYIRSSDAYTGWNSNVEAQCGR